MAEIKSIEQQNFEIEVLTKLASIETKLEDYQVYRVKADEAHSVATDNKEKIKALEDRVSALESKPANNWNELIKIVSSIVITAIVTLVLAKIGLN